MSGKKQGRPPDPWLDTLLSRIERDLATPTGQEMCARAETRTAAERFELAERFPVYSGNHITSIAGRDV